MAGAQATGTVADQGSFEFDCDQSVLRARHGADNQLSSAQIKHKAGAFGYAEQSVDQRAGF